MIAALLAAALLLAPAGRAARTPTWAWPIAPPHQIVRGFVAPASPYGAGHRGIDLAAAPGTLVTAPADGTVLWAGRIVDRGVVSIDHGGGIRSSVEPVEPLVVRGQPVRRGEPIARVATGGTHPPGVLHLGARTAAGYVSPLTFLGGLQRAVLLPLDGAPRGTVSRRPPARRADGRGGSSR